MHDLPAARQEILKAVALNDKFAGAERNLAGLPGIVLTCRIEPDAAHLPAIRTTATSAAIMPTICSRERRSFSTMRASTTVLAG